MKAAGIDLALALADIRDGDRYRLVASEADRMAIIDRLGLLSLDRLEATLAVSRDGEEVAVSGRLEAELSQPCVATGEPVPQEIAEDFAIEFRPPEQGEPDEEVELDEDDLDVVFHDGKTIALGQSVVDTLALALDPYPRSKQADEVLRAAGVKNEDESGPFGALASLKDKMEKGD